MRIPGTKRAFLGVAVVVMMGAVVGPTSWAAAAEAVPHDEVSRLSGSVNADQSRFLPLLDVENGCQPYAAVQDDGSYNGGLNDSGSEAGACRGNGSGQAVVRTQCDAEVCAHMYALYFPKDQGMVGGVATPGAGHRHEWENVVVWTKGGVLAAVAFSQHSGYEIRKPDELTVKGDGASVRYGTLGSVTHSFGPGDGGGSPMPSPVSWESITDEARNTLNTPDTFGGIDFPARDDMFAGKLAKARPSWL